MTKTFIALLVTFFVGANAVLALVAAWLSGDKTLLGTLFTTANHILSMGAGAVLGLLAGRSR